MSLGPLLTEVIVTFCVATYVLYNYGNWMRHHIIVTLAVLVAWYFSFLIVFVLPLDVSSTVFRQCVQESEHDVANLSLVNGSTPAVPLCREPWSYVPDSVFPGLWRVVYWTSQCLTWLVLPLMQSYIKAGDFTVRARLRSALFDNAVYYGSYLLICAVLVIYIATQPGQDLDGQKLKAIAAAASNTWGLLLLIGLLGYALVEVPTSLWNASKRGYQLNHGYFKAAKLSTEKSEAEEAVDDVLESLCGVSAALESGHPLRSRVDTILAKLPAELRDRMARRLPADGDAGGQLDVPSERALVSLHKQAMRSLQAMHRTETQWRLLASKVIELEDVARNQVGHERRFKPTFARPRNALLPRCPALEWYWRCVFHGLALKAAAVACGLLSAAVVWSEVTFFNKQPVLSLFAVLFNLAKADYDYLAIEVLSTLTIAYMCYCAYSTVLKIRFLNLYYLAPHHQTDQYSLIFSGMMLCRLTPPMCLNFLGLIHMDSHIIKTRILETHYTQVMGHLDVVGIISDGFNVYFPMVMIAFCLATYYKLGSRLLSFVGWQQFVGDDAVTADLVDEGRELIKREKRRLQRAEDSLVRRRDFHDRFGTRYRTPKQEDRVRGVHREDSLESARAGLLGDIEPTDYSANTGTASSRGSDLSFPGTGYHDLTAPGYRDLSRPGYQDRPVTRGTGLSYPGSGYQDLPSDHDDLAFQGRVGPPPRGLFDDV